MAEIWIVGASRGDFDTWTAYEICWYPTSEQAIEHAKSAQLVADLLYDLHRDNWNMQHEALPNDYDPHFVLDLDGTTTYDAFHLPQGCVQGKKS